MELDFGNSTTLGYLDSSTDYGESPSTDLDYQESTSTDLDFQEELSSTDLNFLEEASSTDLNFLEEVSSTDLNFQEEASSTDLNFQEKASSTDLNFEKSPSTDGYDPPSSSPMEGLEPTTLESAQENNSKSENRKTIEEFSLTTAGNQIKNYTQIPSRTPKLFIDTNEPTSASTVSPGIPRLQTEPPPFQNSEERDSKGLSFNTKCNKSGTIHLTRK
jgi:hypothetical protein